VGYEADKDLAVLKLVEGSRSDRGGSKPGKKPKPQTLKPLEVGTTQNLRVGQSVFAIGNPFGLDQTLTSGIVSGVGRDIKSITGRRIRDVVQTDAAINPGNSGGPLLDSNGRLIGVNTVIYSPSGASSGVGFAIPSDTVRRVVNQIIRHGRVLKAGMGVHCAADQIARQMNVDGVVVLEVPDGSGAAAAGMRGCSRDAKTGQVVLGDVVVAVDGRRVSHVEDLLARVEDRVVGDVVRVTVEREEGGKRREVDLKVRLSELKSRL
jgi:S1-C subfamily serine protease